MDPSSRSSSGVARARSIRSSRHRRGLLRHNTGHGQHHHQAPHDQGHHEGCRCRWSPQPVVALNNHATHLSTMTRLITLVELRGFEPLTFCMPCRRATNCAIAPRTPQLYRGRNDRSKPARTPDRRPRQRSSPSTACGQAPALCSTSRQPVRPSSSTDQQQLARPPKTRQCSTGRLEHPSRSSLRIVPAVGDHHRQTARRRALRRPRGPPRRARSPTWLRVSAPPAGDVVTGEPLRGTAGRP